MGLAYPSTAYRVALICGCQSNKNVIFFLLSDFIVKRFIKNCFLLLFFLKNMNQQVLWIITGHHDIIFRNTFFYCIFNALSSINKMPSALSSDVQLFASNYANHP